MTKRFYSGARTTSGKLGEAARLKRIEIEKGGKLPFTPQERYRRIMKAKLEENKNTAMMSSKSSFQIPGAKPVERKMSKTTEQAMRLISQRKAMEEEKALRKMVVVKPQTFSDAGRVDKKGDVYDLGNNLTLKIDVKTGTIKTRSGWTVGKYNPKNKFRTNAIITDALKKHGAYFIQQKKMMMLQEQERLAALAAEGSTVWGGGGSTGGLASQQFLEEHYGGVYGSNKPAAHNRGSGVNAWGAMSNSVMGTHAENVWGGVVDNVWGGTDSNIWGGLGGSAWSDGGNAWGGAGRGGLWKSGGGIFGTTNWSKRGMIIWGSGNHKSLLKPLRALLAGVPVIGRFAAPKAKMRSK